MKNFSSDTTIHEDASATGSLYRAKLIVFTLIFHGNLFIVCMCVFVFTSCMQKIFSMIIKGKVSNQCGFPQD